MPSKTPVPRKLSRVRHEAQPHVVERPTRPRERPRVRVTGGFLAALWTSLPHSSWFKSMPDLLWWELPERPALLWNRDVRPYGITPTSGESINPGRDPQSRQVGG